MKSDKSFSRRKFLKTGAFVTAGSLVGHPSKSIAQQEEQPAIKEFRTLGRTGFKVSDIGMGCNGMNEANLVRYAYDHGVNYFDTAEGYGNGDSERKIGEALKYMEREKVFITTKLHISQDESKEQILRRFEKCRQRLNTDYIDALYMHNPDSTKLLNHPGFHQATKEAIADGRLRFRGLSSHGPRREGDSMEKILVTAAEDGRFDLMLAVYNYLRHEAGDQILAACKKNNIGATVMKIFPASIEVFPFDPANPTPEQEKSLQRMMKRGRSRAEAEQRLSDMINQQNKEIEKLRPFLDKYHIKTNEQLRKTTLQWVLSDERISTVLISMREFDIIDKMIPLSGTRLSRAGSRLLKQYGKAIDKSYCRHACNQCQQACPHQLPVSTIMRYAHYAVVQKREKYGMAKYLALGQDVAEHCLDCPGYCTGACPYGVNIQSAMVKSHTALTLA